MGFPRLGAAFYTQTAHKSAQRQLNNVHHAWNVVSQCGPLDSGGLKGGLQFASHRIIQGSVVGDNSKYTAVSQFETIKNFFQMSS